MKRPAINWWANGRWKWQTGFDVGGGDDFVLLYRRAPDAENSRDVIYVTNRAWPRVGINQNRPGSTLDVRTHEADVPALVVGASANARGWLVRYWANGGLRPIGGVWHDGTLESAGRVLASAGIGVGNAVSAEKTGEVVRRFEVFDANGESIGFVPVYDSIR